MPPMQGPSPQGTPGSSRGTSKPWAPPAVIDDNSSAFVRYAVSHRAFAGSGPPSRQSSATLSSQGNGTRQQSIAERMLAGQRLNSTRLKSQELPENEPSEEQAEDDEAPRARRASMDARLPDMPAQRAGSLATTRSHSVELPRKMSGQLSTKSGRRLSTTERMLSGQCLASQRLASQELPEQDPSEEQAEDEEAPPEQRRRSIGHPPTIPHPNAYRPRWAQRQAKDEYMPTRKLPHIMSGIELQMGLDALRESFQPEEDSIAEDPLKPSPFDAAKLDPFSSESEDEGALHKPAGMRTQRTRSEADKTLSNQRLTNQKAGHFEPSESLADDNEIPFDPAGHAASRRSMSMKPPKTPITAKRQPSMTDRMLVGQKLNSRELRDDDVRRPSLPKPVSRASSMDLKMRTGSQGSCKMSVTDRMLSGQRLASQRLASQHLPEYEPSEELPDDYAAPAIAAA